MAGRYILKPMSDQLSQSFEHAALEADIKILVGEIQKHREAPEGENLAGKELLKQAIKSLPQAVSQDQVPPSPSASAKSSLPDYAQNASPEVKLEIEYLLDIAFHQGIAKANAEAQKSPPFVLDAFHDALAGKLYPELRRRGILK